MKTSKRIKESKYPKWGINVDKSKATKRVALKNSHSVFEICVLGISAEVIKLEDKKHTLKVIEAYSILK